MLRLHRFSVALELLIAAINMLFLQEILPTLDNTHQNLLLHMTGKAPEPTGQLYAISTVAFLFCLIFAVAALIQFVIALNLPRARDGQ